MYRSLADRDERRGADDEGFGLVEIMVSMAILALIVLATVPMLIGGLKAGRTAQLNLQGKALAQERLEIMRNLPFHVARQNGQYLDVLDIYFRDLQATGALAANDVCDARSYDPGTSTYACRIDDLGVDYTGFTQTVRTTFLDFQRNPVTPPSTYTSQTAGSDAPASTLLGVAVTTSWTQGSRNSSYTLRSQLANAQADESSLQASLQVSALTLTSNTADGDILQLEGGMVSSEGSLTTGSTASLSVATARAALASGLTESGVGLSLSAPPATNGGSTTPSDSNGHSLNGSCTFACFGQTSIPGDTDVTVALGQPQVSDAANPVTASLRRTGSNTYRGFSYGNATSSQIDPQLDLAGPMVSAGLGSTTEVLRGQGYLDAIGTGATAVTSWGKVGLPMLQLFPTSFAPLGVVQVTLDQATLSCSSGGGSGAVSADWAGTVRYWKQTSLVDGLPVGSYVEYAVGSGQAALPGPVGLVVLDSSFGGSISTNVPLSRWVQSWAALTNPTEAVTSAAQKATGTVGAIVSILTAPTRGATDPTSAINVAVGALACHAEDNR